MNEKIQNSSKESFHDSDSTAAIRCTYMVKIASWLCFYRGAVWLRSVVLLFLRSSLYPYSGFLFPCLCLDFNI